MAWSGKETKLAATLAASGQTWGTTQAPAAGDGLKTASVKFPLGLQKVETLPQTDIAFPSYVSSGNVEGLDYSIEPDALRFNSATTAHPLDEVLMGLLYNGTTATQQGATAAWLHTGTIASNHALANTNSRWFSLAVRYAKDSGYSYLSMPSWMPTGFEWTSDTGSPVKISLKGIGNKVEKDNSTVSAGFGNVTDLEVNRVVQHYHLSTDATNSGVWLAQANAEGGSAVSFTNANLVHPSSISISFNRKMEAVFTDSKYSDAPRDNGFAECKVKMKFPVYTDGLETLIDAVAKTWETGSEVYYHLKSRWQFPTVIASTYYPYYEFGIAKLRITNINRNVDAGKMISLEIEAEALAPLGSTNLPNQFKYVGGASGTAFDMIYLSIMGTTTTALIA